MFNNFFSENRAVYNMSKNTVEPEKPQMTIQYGACALQVGQPKLHARVHMLTPKRLDNSHTHARTHARIHTAKYVIHIAFPREK
jgi:hypothetical protein